MAADNESGSAHGPPSAAASSWPQTLLFAMLATNELLQAHDEESAAAGGRPRPPPDAWPAILRCVQCALEPQLVDLQPPASKGQGGKGSRQRAVRARGGALALGTEGYREMETWWCDLPPPRRAELLRLPLGPVVQEIGRRHWASGPSLSGFLTSLFYWLVAGGQRAMFHCTPCNSFFARADAFARHALTCQEGIPSDAVQEAAGRCPTCQTMDLVRLPEVQKAFPEGLGWVCLACSAVAALEVEGMQQTALRARADLRPCALPSLPQLFVPLPPEFAGASDAGALAELAPALRLEPHPAWLQALEDLDWEGGRAAAAVLLWLHGGVEQAGAVRRRRQLVDLSRQVLLLASPGMRHPNPAAAPRDAVVTAKTGLARAWLTIGRHLGDWCAAVQRRCSLENQVVTLLHRACRVLQAEAAEAAELVRQAELSADAADAAPAPPARAAVPAEQPATEQRGAATGAAAPAQAAQRTETAADSAAAAAAAPATTPPAAALSVTRMLAELGYELGVTHARACPSAPAGGAASKGAATDSAGELPASTAAEPAQETAAQPSEAPGISCGPPVSRLAEQDGGAAAPASRRASLAPDAAAATLQPEAAAPLPGACEAGSSDDAPAAAATAHDLPHSGDAGDGGAAAAAGAAAHSQLRDGGGSGANGGASGGVRPKSGWREVAEQLRSMQGLPCEEHVRTATVGSWLSMLALDACNTWLQLLRDQVARSDDAVLKLRKSLKPLQRLAEYMDASSVAPWLPHSLDDLAGSARGQCADIERRLLSHSSLRADLDGSLTKTKEMFKCCANVAGALRAAAQVFAAATKDTAAAREKGGGLDQPDVADAQSAQDRLQSWFEQAPVMAETFRMQMESFAHWLQHVEEIRHCAFGDDALAEVAALESLRQHCATAQDALADLTQLAALDYNQEVNEVALPLLRAQVATAFRQAQDQARAASHLQEEAGRQAAAEALLQQEDLEVAARAAAAAKRQQKKARQKAKAKEVPAAGALLTDPSQAGSASSDNTAAASETHVLEACQAAATDMQPGPGCAAASSSSPLECMAGRDAQVSAISKASSWPRAAGQSAAPTHDSAVSAERACAAALAASPDAHTLRPLLEALIDPTPHTPAPVSNGKSRGQHPAGAALQQQACEGGREACGSAPVPADRPRPRPRYNPLLVQASHPALIASTQAAAPYAPALCRHSVDTANACEPSSTVAPEGSSSPCGAAVAMPPELCCPLTQALLEDPVIAADGHTYERAALERWLAQAGAMSPATGQPLTHTELVPNLLIRTAARALRDSL